MDRQRAWPEMLPETESRKVIGRDAQDTLGFLGFGERMEHRVGDIADDGVGQR